VISMADRHVDGDHSKGAALNELSLRRGTDDESDFSSILAFYPCHPERSEVEAFARRLSRAPKSRA
jgi:hypothetical protein